MARNIPLRPSKCLKGAAQDTRQASATALAENPSIPFILICRIASSTKSFSKSLPVSRIVTIQEKRLNLPPKEFDLLLTLAQNEQIVMSRERLLQSVWGYDYYGDARTVDTHIKSLREHLGQYRKLIQTVWGVGYKLEYTEEI